MLISAMYCTLNIGFDKSDEILLYRLFQRKSVKWWKKLLHLFSLSVINTHFLHCKTPIQKLKSDQILKKVAEVLSDVGTEIAE